ncbi:MAG: winged helix DNA-binding domain-containing protein [Ginsengibacter sp.]
MTLPDIARYRLINQQIVQSKLESAIEAVAWFGAIQAQEYAHTKWSLGIRLPHLKDDDIENDFTDGKILRTHLLRPTWHFVTPEDIRWMLSLTAPRVNAANAYMYKKLELNSEVFTRCNKILINKLQGNRQLTRNELNEEFKKKKIMAEGIRLSYIMMYAELAGIICSGARHGNQFTYALLNERVPATNSLNKDEGLSRLAKKYFTSRGPATIKDFSTWSGLSLTDCKKGLEMIKSNLACEVIEGDEYYFPPNISLNKNSLQQVYLLPVYDEFVMGYKDRSAILEFTKSLKSKPLFNYDNMIISDGQIIGTWKRTINNKCIDIKLEFFKPLNKTQSKALDNAVHRFEKFTNKSVNYGKKRIMNG